MKNVDRVLIIEFQNKYSASGDNEISNGTRYLSEKAKKKGLPVETVFYLVNGDDFIGTSHYMRNMNPLLDKKSLMAIREGLKKLTNKSELIIRGHGNFVMCTVSKVSPAAMANFLCDMGLNVNCKINITSCKGGRAWQHTGNNVSALSAEDVSVGSFAKKLQEGLFIHGLKSNEIHARVQNVIVNTDGSKTTRTHGSDEKGNHTSKQGNSKLILRGDGNGGKSVTFAY